MQPVREKIPTICIRKTTTTTTTTTPPHTHTHTHKLFMVTPFIKKLRSPCPALMSKTTLFSPTYSKVQTLDPVQFTHPPPPQWYWSRDWHGGIFHGSRTCQKPGFQSPWPCPDSCLECTWNVDEPVGTVCSKRKGILWDVLLLVSGKPTTFICWYSTAQMSSEMVCPLYYIHMHVNAQAHATHIHAHITYI